MAERELTSKELYLINSLKISEDAAIAITNIGNDIHTHKYDVWIAKEYKKDNSLIKKIEEIRYVIDWARTERPNITQLSFSEAYEQSIEWHKNLPKEPVETEKETEDEHVIYKCLDQKHSFVLLEPEDLDYEGVNMGNCVATYKDKVRKGFCFILSLRDEKNKPHVTIEIDANTGNALQIRGKGNAEPNSKYLKLLTEFAIYASDYDYMNDPELLELMNMKF